MKKLVFGEYKRVAKVGDYFTFARPEIHCKRRTHKVLRISDCNPVCVIEKSKSKIVHEHGSSFDDETVYVLTDEEYNALPMFNKEVDYWAQVYWDD